MNIWSFQERLAHVAMERSYRWGWKGYPGTATAPPQPPARGALRPTETQIRTTSESFSYFLEKTKARGSRTTQWLKPWASGTTDLGSGLRFDTSNLWDLGKWHCLSELQWKHTMYNFTCKMRSENVKQWNRFAKQFGSFLKVKKLNFGDRFTIWPSNSILR